MTPCPDIKTLSAYVDGALRHEEELSLRFHLDDCASCRQKVKVLLALKETVAHNAEFHPVPQALREALQARLRPSPWSFLRRRSWAVHPALVVVLLFAVTCIVWWWQREGAQKGYEEIARVLVAEHIHYLQLPDALEITSADPTTITAWFRDRVPFPMHVPLLQDTRLLGGRRCTPLGHVGAVVFYEHEGKRLSLFTLALDVLPFREREALQRASRERPQCFRRFEGRPLCLGCSEGVVRVVVMEKPELEDVAVHLFRSLG